MDKILVFGTGSVSNELINKLNTDTVEILAFVNSNESIKDFFGYKVIVPELIETYDYDYIVIASGYVHAIEKLLGDLHVNRKKIVGYIFDDTDTYKEMAIHLETYLDERYNRSCIKRWLKADTNISRVYPATVWKDSSLLQNIEKDFVREQTVKMIADIITEKNIEGPIAELGVFRGDFTIVINRIFKDRTLYLFDTFDGFSDADLEDDETIDNKIGESSKFKDTSTELVKSRLTYKNNVIFKKGYFPDTFDLYNEKFAFVSIDLNLYQPVKCALDLFYERMQEGGYILVSDYYAPFYAGTKKAIDDWCKEHKVCIVPVADLYGSALIVKE